MTLPSARRQVNRINDINVSGRIVAAPAIKLAPLSSRGVHLLCVRRPSLRWLRRPHDSFPRQLQIRHGHPDQELSRLALLQGIYEDRGSPRQQRRLLCQIRGNPSRQIHHPFGPRQGRHGACSFCDSYTDLTS